MMLCSSLTLLASCAPFESLMMQDEPVAESTPIVHKNRWWQAFHDPLMDALAEDVLAQNLDVKIASARVREARAGLALAQASFLPDISAKGTASRTNTPIGLVKPASIAQGGFDTVWEWDMFGQLEAQEDAAQQRLSASEARREDVVNSVIAELMRSIVNLRQAQQTLEESRALLDNHDTQIALIAARAKAGLIDHTLLARAQAERAQTATQLPIAQAMHDGAIYHIEQLMGVPSGALRERILSTQGKLAVPPASETINITLESMRDRPDIRSARSDMLAVKSDLAKAEADLWPRISIKSFFGVQEGSEGLPVAANPLWSLSGGITMPILNFGRLHRAIDAADARVQSAIAGYERASLIALAETNTALSDYVTGINAVEHQEDAFALRTHTVQLATTRYERGFTDMTDLTTAQSELNQATLLLIARKATVAQAYIRLHKALGFR